MRVPIVQDLPAQLDTLGALRLAASLREARLSGQPISLSASTVEHVGLVALQLLAAARGDAAQRGASLDLIEPSNAFAEGVRAAGLGAALLDEPEAASGGRALRFRFTDAALRFGEEPLDRLAALRQLGVTISAALPAARAAEILAEPDRLLIEFSADVGDHITRADIEAALITSDGSCILHDDDREDMPAPLPPGPAGTAAHTPAQEALIPIERDKLEAIVDLVGDLMVSQSTLMDRLGTQRAALATEIADLSRTISALQEGIVRIATNRLDTLLATIAGAERIAITGGDIEIDRGLFDRIAPGIAALLPGDGAITVTADQDGGFLVIGIALASPSPATGQLRDLVHSCSGRLEIADEGRALEMRLPRSLTLLDAIIVEAGSATYAVPVSHMIEGLRPASEVLHRFDDERLLLHYREQYIPVVAIGERFRLDGWEPDPVKAVLVVVRAGGATIALQADTISDQRQVALKPLGGGLSLPDGIAGAAIMGAHRIALVLDLTAFVPAPASMQRHRAV